MVKLFNTYIKNNLGLINLFGKVSGRVLFLLLTSFFAYKLSFKTFAAFAIFWTALRMLTFFSANNLYIICFNEVRESLLNKMECPVIVSANIVVTFITITDVELTVDLSLAKIFYSTFPSDSEKVIKTQKGLEAVTGFLRSKISKSIRLHHAPELKFIYDDSLERGRFLSNLIEEACNKTSKN